MQSTTPSGPGTKVAAAAPRGAPNERHLSKLALAWLACLFGVFGLHWWYLGRPKAWVITLFSVSMLALAQLYPSWWENPAFLILIIPATAGFIESLIFALKPDEAFDAKYNPASGQTTRTGWGAVIAAIFTMLVGGMVVTLAIAVIVVYVYTSMGWLDGYVF